MKNRIQKRVEMEGRLPARTTMSHRVHASEIKEIVSSKNE